MRKWLYLLLVGLMLAALIPLAGCASEDTVKVGALLDVTGPVNAPLGKPEKQMLLLMQEQINEAGGINGKDLELVIYDTKGDETECVNLANRLIEQDGVVAILGPTSTGESLAVVPVADAAKIPLISLAADERITIPVGDSIWVFKTPQTTFMAVREIYSDVEEQGYTDIAIITDKKGFGAGGKQDLIDEAANYGLNIVSQQEYNNEDLMDPYVSAIATSGAQALVCWGTNPGPANIAVAAKAKGIPFFGSHGIANQTFIDLAGDAANGVRFPVGKLPVANQLPATDPQKAVLLEIIADYVAKYPGESCSTFAGHAWDAMSMLKLAIEEAGTTDKAKVRNELENIEGFVGTGGIFNMSSQDHCGLSEGCMVVVEIVDGEWTLAS